MDTKNGNVKPAQKNINLKDSGVDCNLEEYRNVNTKPKSPHKQHLLLWNS